MHDDSAIENVQVRHRGPGVRPQPGDLLFGNRPCSVQMLMNLAGDQWTHIALVTDGDDGPRTVELGPNGLFSRSAQDFVDRYRLVGLARPNLSDRCRRSVVTAAAIHLELGELDYSWPHCVLIGSTAMLRRLAPGTAQERVVRTGLRAADRLRATRGSGANRRATCSSLMVDVLDAACEHCRPDLQWPARHRVLPWRPRPTATDVAPLHRTRASSGVAGAARAMVTPADVWVAEGYGLRAVIDGERTTVLHDLMAEEPPVPRQPQCAAA